MKGIAIAIITIFVTVLVLCGAFVYIGYQWQQTDDYVAYSSCHSQCELIGNCEVYNYTVKDDSFVCNLLVNGTLYSKEQQLETK